MTGLSVEPLTAPPDAVVTVPGSKSITNRALLAAALAAGSSELDGILVADDTVAMVDCLRRLGVEVELDAGRPAATVHGTGGRFVTGPVDLDARHAGTVARFLPPAVAAGEGCYRFDGSRQLRGRPMGPMLGALRQLGALVEEEGPGGHLPFSVTARRATGGTVRLPGDVSSQYVSGLLLAGPLMADGLHVQLGTDPVSDPYLDLTAATMAAFGGRVERPDRRHFRVPGTGYRPAPATSIEPDASAASYFLAAAVICGGRVRVPGLGRSSLQGDVGFVDLLEQMGARVTWEEHAVEVTGTGTLHGIEADMGHISDTAQTLAAVAVFADGPTRVTGVGFIRRKETDRVGAVVRELRRCGIDAEEEPDGFVVHPGTPRPAVVQTDGDHRMAMSFALLGLRAGGIRIDDPGCVAKTFPGFWESLDRLRAAPPPCG